MSIMSRKVPFLLGCFVVALLELCSQIRAQSAPAEFSEELPFPIIHSGMCENERVVGNLPCVLPVNTNFSFSDLGAGAFTSIDVSIDLYPAPRCTENANPDHYYSRWECRAFGLEHVTEPAVIHSSTFATLFRIVLPRGFDATGASLASSPPPSIVDAETNFTTTGPTPVPLRLSPSPRPLSYGIAEPNPSRLPETDFEINTFPTVQVTSTYRTGSTWALRDPDYAFDGSRVVDVVTAGTFESWSLDTSTIPESVQRLRFRIDGIRNRQELGFVESAVDRQERVLALQVYKAAREGAGLSTDPNRYLMRFYNTRIHDPCADDWKYTEGTLGMTVAFEASEEAPWGAGVRSHVETLQCDAGAGMQHGTMHWFNGTTTAPLPLLCPAGTSVISGGYGFACAPCLNGTYSNTTLSATCLPCPDNTFSDPDSRLVSWGGARSCLLCPPGQVPVAVGCQACPPGSYSGGEECITCEQGSYMPDSAATACIKCPTGTSTPAPAATDPSLCRPLCLAGQVGVGGVEPCSECVEGFFIPQNGSRDCEPCPPGSYSDIIGQAQCTNCSLGSYAPAYASTVCTLCAVYQYNDAVGASACTLCPTDSRLAALELNLSTASSLLSPQYTQALASLSPSLQAGVIRTRAVGLGATSLGECLLNCPPGHTSFPLGLDEPGNPCTPCGYGTFSPEIAGMLCSDCAEGTYSNITGNTVCAPCEPGTHAPHLKSQVCGGCSSGSFSLAAASSCTGCSAGTAAPAPGSASCPPCPPAITFAPEGSSTCEACAPGTAAVSDNAQDCQSLQDQGVVAHWELEEGAVSRASSFSRVARRDARCSETQDRFISPSDLIDRAGNFPPAELRGPPCGAGMEWEQEGGSGLSLETFLVSAPPLKAMQFSPHFANFLVVGEIEALQAQNLLPTGAMSVEI